MPSDEMPMEPLEEMPHRRLRRRRDSPVSDAPCDCDRKLEDLQKCVLLLAVGLLALSFAVDRGDRR